MLMNDKEINLYKKCKIIILGDCNVGKSNFFLRISKKIFNEEYKQSIEIQTVKILQSFKDHQGFMKKIIVDLYDTFGQERYRNLINNYYKNVDGIIFMYDVTDQKSFENIKNWFDDAVQFNSNKNCSFFIIGNKIDLKDKIIVKKEDVNKIIDEYKIKYKIDNLIFDEISCKENINVDETFQTLCKFIYNNKQINNDEDNNQIQITDLNHYKKKKKKCKS